MEEFRKLCMKTVKPCEEDYRDLWKSPGFGVDWSLQYQTLSPRSQRISQRLIGKQAVIPLYGYEILILADDLRVSRRFLNKLYNASRFVLLQLPEPEIRTPQELLPIDGWILQRVEEIMKKAGKLLSE